MRKDFIFGLLGNFSAFIANFLLVPLYINHLGSSANGVVSLVSTLMSIFVLLDAGLGVTVARDISLRRDILSEEVSIGHMVSSLESVYFIIGFLITLLVFTLSNFLAEGWLMSDGISKSDLAHYLKLISLIILVKWPVGLYQNVLLGYGKIGTINLIKSCLSVFQIALSYLFIVFFNYRLQELLIFLIALNGFGLIVYSYLAWNNINVKRTFLKFDFSILLNLKQQVVGASLFSIIGVFYMNTDKFFLTKYFTLEIYGYYMVVTTLGLSLLQFIYPLTTTLFKSYSSVIANNKIILGSYKVRFAYQVAVVFCTSFILFLDVFGIELIKIWTGSSSIPKDVYSAGIPFYYGLLPYALHNVLIIPLIINAKYNVLNIIYISSWLLLLIANSFLIPGSNDVGIVASIFCVVNFLLFVLSYFGLLNSNLLKWNFSMKSAVYNLIIYVTLLFISHKICTMYGLYFYPNIHHVTNKLIALLFMFSVVLFIMTFYSVFARKYLLRKLRYNHNFKKSFS